MNFLSLSWGFFCVFLFLMKKSAQSPSILFGIAPGIDILEQLMTNNELQTMLGPNKYPGRDAVLGSNAKDIHPDDSTLSELYKIRMYLEELAQKRKRAVNMVPRLGRELAFYH